MNREWITGLSSKEHRLGESETKINREAQEEGAPVGKMNNKGLASGGGAWEWSPITLQWGDLAYLRKILNAYAFKLSNSTAGSLS